jgi:16S rRNA (guanine1516-N2)-methyltransferase
MHFAILLPPNVRDLALTELATRTGAPVIPNAEAGRSMVVVHRTGPHLELSAALEGGNATLRLDWSRPRAGLSRATSLLGKAIGGRRGDLIVDATAGLGRDAHELACLGYRVTAIERHPVLALLLREAVAQTNRLAAQLEVREADALDALGAWPRMQPPHAVYLDPMFPPREKSAQVKKDAQLLQRLVGHESPLDAVFAAAWGLAPRIVVKRPKHAPPLAEGAAFAVAGRAVRFDVYLTLNRPVPRAT